MQFLVKPVKTAALASIADDIRRQVFEREWCVPLAGTGTTESGNSQTFLATTPFHEPVGVVTAVDSTGDRLMRENLGLGKQSVRLARYSQLAVLKPYRGMHVPLKLLIEARADFVVPEKFDYSCLLFDATRAPSSSYCAMLGFRPSPQTVRSCQGPCRILFRCETAPSSDLRDKYAGQYLEVLAALASLDGHAKAA